MTDSVVIDIVDQHLIECGQRRELIECKIICTTRNEKTSITINSHLNLLSQNLGIVQMMLEDLEDTNKIYTTSIFVT